MPKKQKQKQLQTQSQKVVVNVGEVKKRKRVKKRRPREPSQEAQEYAEAISRIVPRIQYTFPSHSSFNYDPYKTANLVPQTKPEATDVAIPLTAPPKLNAVETLATQKDRSNLLGQFVDAKPQPDLLPIKKPEPTAPYREIPINHPDRIPSLTQGLEQFEKNEEAPLVKPSRKVNKPSAKTIVDYLNGRGLPDTPSNRELAIEDILRAKQSSDAATVRKNIQKELRTANKELVESGRASVPRQRPVAPIMEKEKQAEVPILQAEPKFKVFTLADISEKQENIARLEKRLKSTRRGPRLIIEGEPEIVKSVSK